MEYVLQTKDLTKHYRKFKALDGVTMNVPKGSVYGLVGRNGAGKTTLMRVICGLQDPSGGSYSIYGVDSTDRKITASRRRMGAVIEKPAIYLNMTARQNMKVQYSLLGLPDDEGIDQLLELVGLSDTGKKRARKFSLGMKQRLGIAVALAGSPDFLLLDEPINGLDPQGIVEIRELILKLSREQNITVLISSHILSELSLLATHYGFVDKGRIVKEISAEELEKQVRKSMKVKVSDTKALARVLDGFGLEYEMISDSEGKIYGSISVTQLSTALMKEGCELLTVSEADESLEAYFIDLVGGETGAKAN
ncbi:MAG: ATP-binding cassette domain-containing protein [Ruminococcus sp.]|nr:ATP-binding cassette domain-containing protein [Ruminococcus sp.]